MKKLIIIFILLSIILAGCNQQNSKIVATTLPVYEFSAALCAGTEITVSRLVTENVSCLHDYSLQVSQMQAIEAAQVVIINGAGLEDFLGGIIDSKPVIDTSVNLMLSCGMEHDGHEHEHDPHLWLSPQNAKQMCKTICGELSALYPAYREQFEKNLDSLLARLDALQAYGELNLKDLTSRDIITFHNGFAYFAESFDLRILKAVEEESGSEASAKELIELIQLVNDNHLPAIFTEANGSTSAANTISAETGAKIFSLDMAMSGNSYFESMYHNINTIKEALG